MTTAAPMTTPVAPAGSSEEASSFFAEKPSTAEVVDVVLAAAAASTVSPVPAVSASPSCDLATGEGCTIAEVRQAATEGFYDGPPQAAKAAVAAAPTPTQ